MCILPFPCPLQGSCDGRFKAFSPGFHSPVGHVVHIAIWSWFCFKQTKHCLQIQRALQAMLEQLVLITLKYDYDLAWHLDQVTDCNSFSEAVYNTLSNFKSSMFCNPHMDTHVSSFHYCCLFYIFFYKTEVANKSENKAIKKPKQKKLKKRAVARHIEWIDTQK